ncbi:hypothetical protein FBUS_08074 [Fasciolopsis buskii]|uniref:RING-type domain-containing protein n=1 Tax=Fasciolopsis buskii TaxID=27845 RepID=A0A8E0RRU4_9TREM|nr:hypothetical protein FBUS_08074 [Fasciolopsis buski]
MKHVHGKILHRYNISHDSVMGYKAPTGSVTDNLNLFFRDLDDCLLGFRGVLSQWEDTFKDKISKSLGNCKHRTTDATWKPIWNRHLKRGAGCCPICLVPWERRRPRVLLTCSHVFHQTCLETMETVGSLNEFLTASELNGNMCPVCRQTDYEKCSVPSTDD